MDRPRRTNTILTLARWVVAITTASFPCSVPADDVPAGPLPGQIVVDPQHPQWLKRHGGGHVFVCGPGDPEDFLYVGDRNSDGTRNGDQVERINKLIEHGGNCIYMQVVRTHGGDARPDNTQNPFVGSDPSKGLDADILDQWEDWFALMDRSDILIYLFLYDDGSLIWDTGDTVGAEEQAFIEGIVNRFEHHKNLIWIVGEESEERYSTARVQAIAHVIQQADDHDHLIGNHHLSGTTFKAWRPAGAVRHYSMQLNLRGDEAHRGAIEARNDSARRYQIIYSESTAAADQYVGQPSKSSAATIDVDGVRRHAWAVAMGGLMPMLLRLDVASTPAELLEQFRHLQLFFEATDFYTMQPHDELADGETTYVLADPGRSYLAYADRCSQAMGVKDVPAGQCVVSWLDCQTGATSQTQYSFPEPGRRSFARPRTIGTECAAWIRFQGAKESGLVAREVASATTNDAPENRPPVARDQKITARSGRETYVQLHIEDADGPGPYSYTIIQTPQHGKLQGDNNDRFYTAGTGFAGTDKFTWKVHDGLADSEVTTTTITVEPAKVNFPPPDSEGGWRTLTEAGEIRRLTGFDREKLDDAFEWIKRDTKNGGLLVVRHGWLVYERYFGHGHREALCNLASCSKSFTAIAAGILMNEYPDRFPEGLKQRVYTPEYLPAEAFPLTDPRKQGIRIGQLLAMTAGIRGNNPVYVDGRESTIEPIGPDGWQAMVDAVAFGNQEGEYSTGSSKKRRYTTKTLWCDPGEGWSYATSSIHLVSTIIRHVSGRELEDYIAERLAEPLGWGRWGFGYKYAKQITHTPGGGGIAPRPTDMLRFGYLLLHEGRWNDQQVVPAEYVRHCATRFPFNPHFDYSLQFDVNTGGRIDGVPRDTYWKRGSGGHALFVVPSLDLVVWKLGGRDGQYSSNDTGMPVHPEAARTAEAREDWQRTVGVADAAPRTLQLIVEALRH